MHAMISVPGADRAVIDERKLTSYLLSDSHPAGRSKAVFFRYFGFEPAEWRRLQQALSIHIRASDVVGVDRTDFGLKYTVVGRLETPSGRSPFIRSVWFVATGQDVPRLVTAYPEPESKE